MVFSPDGRTLAAAGLGGQVSLWETATGKKYREWQLPGPVHRLAFLEDGRHLVTANENGTFYVLRLGRGVQAPAGPAALWEALAATEADRAYPAVWALAADPRRALELFRDRLRPAEAVDPRHVLRLIDRLNDNRFEEREKAKVALEQLRERAEPALRRKLAEGPPPLEMRRRIEHLLDRPAPLPPERLQTLRAIHVLEQVGNRDSRDLLERLARGAPDARETQEARAALKRLAERQRGR
jgi:hypothetical protein